MDDVLEKGDRKINLLIAIAGLGIGGAEVVVQRLAEAIDRKKFNLTICCLKVRGRIGDEMAQAGTDIVVLSDGNEHKVNYLTFIELLKLIRSRRIDIVHSHTTDALADAAVCKLLMPWVKLVHTFHFGNYPHRAKSELRLERIFSRFATRLLAVGEVQRQQLRSVFGFSEKTVGRVWNGVAFASGVRDDSFRNKLVRGNQVLVGTICTLIEQKGLFDFLAVAKKLKDAGCNVHFVIVGEGHLRPKLEALRNELGLDDMVSMPGWVTNAADVALPAFDIFFQPSLWEAMSIALLEAMAASKAIVATRVGENPYLVTHETDGLLVDAKDVDGMAVALQRLVTDSELRLRFGAAAAEKAREQFSVARMTRAYEDIYESMLPRRLSSRAAS